ncbi:MAG: phenylalanine--tRNA ligase subunit alpha [Endomicrobium sp.]|jgi:phenylalanyl-tRNA synthetase alpha chain|nr:phenylalanine--tRNA ligase subunit alpha [Endomicrobium sp.]
MINIKINDIVADAYETITKAKDKRIIDDLSLKYLGKKSKLSKMICELVNYALPERKVIAIAINKAKNDIKNLLQQKKQEFSKAYYHNQKCVDQIDCSSSSLYFPFKMGSLHPVVTTMESIVYIFQHLGFSIFEGNDIETDWYNFEALNIPKNHPARDTQDTFYLNKDKTTLLRTHTSPAQIHIMETHTPPIKIVVPGRVYRNETQDVSHSSTFHQVEGLVVNEYVTFADLKTIVKEFVFKFFKRELKIRFRPSYFQFTEPSAEVDIQCYLCQNNKIDCKICKNSGWIEILGCGMVHPNVFKSVKYDNNLYRGYAFGIGVERLAMVKHNIEDIRLFYANELAFLQQF